MNSNISAAENSDFPGTDANPSQRSDWAVLNPVAKKRMEYKTPSVTVKSMKAELDTLRKQKNELDGKLARHKEDFSQSLNMELRQVEQSWKDQVKRLHFQKRQLQKFTARLMDDSDTPIWMVAYSDMATLLLTFFILYYSIASININKFKTAILGENEPSIGLLELVESVKITKSIRELTGQQSSDILSEIRESAKQFPGQIEMTPKDGKVAFQIPAQFLFQSGSTDLQKSGRPVLDKIIEVFKKFPQYQVNVQGHSDDVPISTLRFPTNWELSASRATSVLRYFIDKDIQPTRLTATGFADTFPLYSNDTEIGRSKNRRVEFVLEKK